MAYVDFEAPDGSKWQVWRILPTALERRRGERRVAVGAGSYTGPERRVNPDRRQKVSVGRTVVSPGYEQGWLCFENEEGEKRRLVPVPEDWEEATPDRLWMWCRVAKRVVECGPRP